MEGEVKVSVGRRITPADLRTDVKNDWCPGCGDFAILSALYQAIAELSLEPSKTVIVSGIGCSGKTPHFIRVNGIHTLHGRTLPYATGIKLANPSLCVIAVGGDGDGYGIGVGHFVATGRRNVDITYIVFNNGVYGLTKGQASPTLRKGDQPKSLKLPNIQDSINPIALAISSGWTFVARAFAYDVKELKNIIKEAILHKGSAFIDVLQPCPTFNTVMTRDWYRQNIAKLDGTPKTLEEAMRVAFDSKLWVGIIWRVRKDTFEERISERLPQYPELPPALSVRREDLSGVLKKFEV